MKEVRNKWQIKNIIHYLIKWADWSSEYNSYEFVSHLVNTLKAVFSYECKLKHKCKKVQISNENENEDSESEAVFCKQWK